MAQISQRPGDVAFAQAARRRATGRRTLTNVVSYVWIGLIAITTILPYLWMISTSIIMTKW